MASSEAPVGGFHCLECGNQVEIVHGDKKLSVDLHKLSHIKLDTKSQDVDRPSSDSFGKSNSSSSLNAEPYTCHICNEKVEILYNDIKLSLEIHSKKHSDQLGIPSEDQMSNSSGSISKKSTKKINKVKNKQNVVDSTIIDDAFITLPPCLRAHRGFILKNADGIFCNICKMNVDIFSISEHLKTNLHEDNTIVMLKNFISDDLHSSLDWLAFSGSNLLCNLCNCKIDLCSSNPHETIVNVFVHNAQNVHLKKSSTNGDLNHKSDDAQRILQTLSETSPVISENRTYLDITVQPHFNCRLCSLSIAYDEDNTTLLDNLNSHFIGQDHAKYRTAALTLQLFETLNTPFKENHMLVVSKGFIYCKRCFCNIPSDTTLIEEHLKSCPATRINKNDPFFKLVQEMLIKVPSLVRSSAVTKVAAKKILKVQEPKYFEGFSKELPLKIALDLTVQKEGNKEKESYDIKANDPIDIKRLLSSMPAQFRDVGYIVEDDDGRAVKCLVCDCRIPPAHYNLETHLTGRNHKSNEDRMKTGSIVFGEAAGYSSVPKSETLNLVDQVFENLTRNDPVVKANDIILMDFGDGMHYFCTACGDLIPTSTDTNTFKLNIYQHVKSATHLHRFPHQKHIIGTQELSKDTRVRTIDEFFAALPKDLQGDRQFIKPNRDERNSLYCSLCRVKVPIRVRNLQEHLEGGYHTDLFDKHSAPQDFFSKAVGFAVSVIQDVMFQKIKMSDKLIKDNEKHLSRKGEDYLCVLCSATIKNCTDPEELTDRFLNHLEGKNHVQNVVIKLMQSNPAIRDEKAFVKVKNQTVHCTKCDIALPRGFEEANLKKHVFAHFSGNRHNNSTNSSQIPSSSQSKPVNIRKMPNSTIPNQPTASDKTLKSSHQHTANNSTVPRPLIDNNTSYSFNPVYEAFRNVPTHLHIDMKYIKTGTIPDFLTCTLCSKTINPFYLKDHLVEENHLKEKTVFEERVSHWKMRVM